MDKLITLYKKNDTLKNIEYKYIIYVSYKEKYMSVLTNQTDPKKVLEITQSMINEILKGVYNT